MKATSRGPMTRRVLALCTSLFVPSALFGQGVTTAALLGTVTDRDGTPLADASVVALHVPSGTEYRAVSRVGGAYNVLNMRVGGPYRVTATRIGYRSHSEENVFVSLGQDLRLDFRLVAQAVELEAVEVAPQRDEVLNAGRTGAATFIDPAKVTELPSIKRSTRDLIRLDPRSDDNYSFAGRNWLYNNISLDGSYFNNPFGLDDPAPGGQTNAEPVPYDAVEQVEVSVAPFDVRQGGFTGANVNTVTKSGTNEFRGSVYGFGRNQDLVSNTVSGQQIVANPNLGYSQVGGSLGGPLMRDKLFFFVDGELERTHFPGSDFVAGGGATGIGLSRVDPKIMDSIRTRMITVYNYDPGPYQGYTYHVDNDKLLAKLDWNVNPNNNLTFRWDYLHASRDLPPHPFVLSYNNTGRGPNASSLPFYKAGYAINNHLNSFALELNSRSAGFANRFFASYNRFRDFRAPFSEDFPTIEIGQGGVTYTTLGHEPFSIHNILDQDVWQFTNNFSLYRGKHVFTFGANYERFSFFNSFNLFRDGVFFLPAPAVPVGSTFSSLSSFFNATDPSMGTPFNFRGLIGTGPYKGEDIALGQLGLYAEDEVPVSGRVNLTYGLRVDLPMYYTTPIDNPFSRSLIAHDQNGNTVTVDEGKLPGVTPLFGPRLGFNWNAVGERQTQVRGGTGIFTGRIPFVWAGNVISNPGSNPNLYPAAGAPVRPTGSPADSSTLAQSFDVNAMDPNFKWPQVWTTDLAVDQELPGAVVGTLEVVYGKDIHAVVMRNYNLGPPVRYLPAPDGRPYYGGNGNPLNASLGGAGIYVLGNTSEGHSLNITASLRKYFPSGLGASIAYNFLDAKNNLKSTEIASVLWSSEPVRGDPNNPELGFSEFGQRHRLLGTLTYTKGWSPNLRTQVGVVVEVAQGNSFLNLGAGGNRWSFTYAGDVNGDGNGGNDLIYIPRNQSEILLDPCPSACGANTTPAQQWAALNAFIEQDGYLRSHRGQIAERFGESNPWYENVDLRVLQDLGFGGVGTHHGVQLSFDMLNVMNLLSSSWGVRKIANPAAISPLTLVRFDAATGAPVFNFTGPAQTFIEDPSLLSRWRMQLGIRYLLN